MQTDDSGRELSVQVNTDLLTTLTEDRRDDKRGIFQTVSLVAVGSGAILTIGTLDIIDKVLYRQIAPCLGLTLVAIGVFNVRRLRNELTGHEQAGVDIQNALQAWGVELAHRPFKEPKPYKFWSAPNMVHLAAALSWLILIPQVQRWVIDLLAQLDTYL